MTGAPTTVRLTLELELHRDPVTGTITTTDDGTRAFTGWLELAPLIEAARRGNANHSSRHAQQSVTPPSKPDAQG